MTITEELSMKTLLAVLSPLVLISFSPVSSPAQSRARCEAPTIEEPADYTVQSARSFEDAVAAVQAGAKQKGFGVLGVHDLAETLASKGFPRDPVKVVEVCNPSHASRVLAANPRIASMLPCRIAVYVKDGKVFVSTVRPLFLGRIFPDPAIREVAGEVDTAVRAIVDSAR
jgi:uncharacterized protein (DUF302 family)